MFYRERGVKGSKCWMLSIKIEALVMASTSLCRTERDIANSSKETIKRIAETLNLTPLEITDLFKINLPKKSLVDEK